MTDAAPLLAPGVLLAETYEIERPLGTGGMGEVWLAKHRRLAGKQVAVKVLHVDRQLPQEAVARFKREAEIAARLEHPNIVQVLDFNTLPSGHPYLVMEFLKGQSLAARANGQPLPLEHVFAIMRQVGAALQAAHRAGVVHRDLKPENIFLVPTALGDQVKVLDFGISKLSDSNTVQTTDAVLIGTPLYMSPEQALGNNRDVAPQSDLFSLGSITYELLTGTAPYAADSIAKVVFRIAYEKHPPLIDRRADLPSHVVAAVEHALEKDRTRRTPSIEAFVHELTGDPLVELPRGDGPHGVYSPGMAVTASLLTGATVGPLATGPRATDAVAPAPSLPRPSASAPTKISGDRNEVVAMPEPTVVSGKKVMISMVVAAVVIAAIVTKVRMDNWAERAAYRATMIDAGWVLLENGDLARDAGPTVVTAVEVPDAGVPVAEVTVDAGRVAVAPQAVKHLVPATETELQSLAGMQADAARGDWDSVWNSRSTARLGVQTTGAKYLLYSLLLEAVCARHDTAQLAPMVNELRPLATGAQMVEARKKCNRHYPEGDSLW